MADVNSESNTSHSGNPARNADGRSSAPGPDRTVSMTPQSSVGSTDATPHKARTDQEIAQELRRLGISADDIRRIVDAPSNLDATTLIPPSGPAKPADARLPSRRLPTVSSKPSLDSLQAFAQQLKSGATASKVASLESVVSFPEFRESTVKEIRDAETLMREANILRRREKFVDAEVKCREALNLVPKDAAALELLGDIFQGVARVDEALAAYKRATQASPARISAEQKFADLMLRQQNWANYDPEAVGSNPLFAVLLSLVFPGIGQFYNKEIAKGVVFVLLGVLCIFLVGWSPWGLLSTRANGRITTAEMGIVILCVVVYVTGMVDAKITAKRAALD